MAPTKEEIYSGHMCTFMNYLNGTNHTKEHHFTDEQLIQLTPNHIIKFFRFRAFEFEEDRPINEVSDWVTGWRGSTLEAYKRSISHFMPNKIPTWDRMNQQGNPTKSGDINDFIKLVKKLEVRKKGKPSQAKRALTRREFNFAINLLEEENGFFKKVQLPTMMKLQYHLIGRSDDICKLETLGFEGHPDPRFSKVALSCTVFWSKAVFDERQCPPQILLGSMDTNFCFFVALSIYLEHIMSYGNGRHCKYVFCNDVSCDSADSPLIDRIKKKYLNNLRQIVFKNPEFMAITPNGQRGLGSHSLRKFASSFAKQNGCTMQDVETRGRWKSNQHKIVAGRYVDVHQPQIDGKVESYLCVGGPVAYKIVEGSNVTLEWLYHNVVPGIFAHYGGENTICEILGLSLLWTCHEETQQFRVPTQLLQQVRDAYLSIRGPDSPPNPVKRVCLTVYTLQENLCIDEILPMVNEDGTPVTQQPVVGVVNRGVTVDHINGIMIQQQQQKQQIEAAINGFSVRFAVIQTHFEDMIRTLNKNITRIAVQPPRMANAVQRQHNLDVQAVEERQQPAELSKAPKTLFDLWVEYQTGIGGLKAAKDFTPAERGRCKKTYCRRKSAWDTMDRLIRIRPNFSIADAIDAIHSAYGRRLPVSAIIDKLVTDKRTGGHPNLR
jgi:hypothetical protein